VTRRLLLALALAGATVAGVVVANAHSPHAPRTAGRIVQASFHSDALRGTDHYAVYLPPGYAHSRKRYPVVYFLHGLPQTPTAYRSVIVSVAHAVDRSGYQAIVVAPQGARAGESDPEWLDRGPGHNWETATAVELVRTVDSRYRTIASRRGRLLIGVSAGGYGATLIADHNPGTYSVIESWSGYFHATNPAGTAPLDLGSEEANDWADFHKQIPQLRQQFGRWWGRTWFGFYVGTNDPHFLAENRQLYAELRSARVPHVLFRIYQGGHSWGLWQGHAVDWMRAGLVRAARAAHG
jgi:enterochelin esterase-like enzyme